MENDVAFGQRIHSKVHAACIARRCTQGSLLRIVGAGKPGVAATGSDGTGRRKGRVTRTDLRYPDCSTVGPNRSRVDAGPSGSVLSAMPYRIAALRRSGTTPAASPTGLTPTPSTLTRVNPTSDKGALRAASHPGSSSTRILGLFQAVTPLNPIHRCLVWPLPSPTSHAKRPGQPARRS